ncbi:TRAF3-interacting protein [Achlya hypogyna]|uniref:TRAF3-interacting protein 1 n=1 Tax=Achlya hypogyna TaxID=1202772 RepID=A0A1V9ZGW6_ACHHY|nr:TRAF3-interacting protein [Achlya hypogyna]
MGDVNELIKKTQETLQPLIPKPKLAEKLLLKPPFRFIHDIFTALIASTGFAKGLYTDYELDSANIKEKHQKLQFLDKMIYCTGQCHGRDIDVRSAKIVAGLEPENTNLFLAELAAAAANSSLDWGGAVQKTLGAYPALPETLAGSGGAAPAEVKPEAKRESTPPAKEVAKETPKEAPKDDAKEAEDKAKAEEKARERARRAKEEKAKQEREKEAAEPKPSSAGSSSRPSSNSKATREDNNSEFAAQIGECNTDVERTKDMIEKLIAKPKMSAKLLGKPPFRFLHDIISELTRTTGFADGLYAGDELDSNAIKEKQPKIDYLQKIISCVSVRLNVDVEAKPAKIVAGLEPEETNKFLQLLAVAAKAGTAPAAVQRVLAGDTALRPVHSAEAKGKRASVARPEEPAEAKKEEKAQPKAAEAPSVAAFGASGPLKPTATAGLDDDADLKAKAPDNDEDELKPGTANRTARPTTARRRPPKLKENVKEVGRLVRDEKATPTVGIMKDGDNAESDDEGGDGDNNARGGGREIAADDGHGKLVRNILKDQTADEEANRAAKEEEAKDADGGIRLGKRRKSFKEKTKGGTSTAAEINELRTSIQKICQATNPVGKCIEYVYEDMEAMARELEVWKQEYERKCVVLEEEKKKSEDALQPLTLQLVEVDEQIKEQLHKINTLKATIAKNEDKTLKLLRMVVTA